MIIFENRLLHGTVRRYFHFIELSSTAETPAGKNLLSHQILQIFRVVSKLLVLNLLNSADLFEHSCLIFLTHFIGIYRCFLKTP